VKPKFSLLLVVVAAVVGALIWAFRQMGAE
jgi:hypothetical protein